MSVTTIHPAVRTTRPLDPCIFILRRINTQITNVNRPSTANYSCSGKLEQCRSFATSYAFIQGLIIGLRSLHGRSRFFPVTARRFRVLLHDSRSTDATMGVLMFVRFGYFLVKTVYGWLRLDVEYDSRAYAIGSHKERAFEGLQSLRKYVHGHCTRKRSIAAGRNN